VGRFADGLPGKGLVGKSVVDTEGIELGYVMTADDRFLTVGEGPMGSLRIGKRFVDRVADRVLLKGTLVEMFSGLNVIDSAGEFVGIVRDTIETEDTWDSVLVEDEEGEMVVVVLEDIKSIDEFVELDVTGEELYESSGA
jgi:sporulation protein YlmC with PRC-barrel domain